MGNILIYIFARTPPPPPEISFIFKGYGTFCKIILNIKKKTINNNKNYLIHFQNNKGILENVVWEENCNADDGKFINYIQKLVIDLTNLTEKDKNLPLQMKMLCIKSNLGYLEQTFHLDEQTKIFEYIEDILTSISAIKNCSERLFILI